jgi:hypothetical protein
MDTKKMNLFIPGPERGRLARVFQFHGLADRARPGRIAPLGIWVSTFNSH